MKFFLPGVFLLLLGLGNILVGMTKSLQYDRLLAELSAQENNQTLEEMAPLERVQAANRQESRVIKNLSTAVSRREFYSLVTLGGEVFVGLSAGLLLVSAILKVRKPSETREL